MVIALRGVDDESLNTEKVEQSLDEHTESANSDVPHIIAIRGMNIENRIRFEELMAQRDAVHARRR